MVDILSCSSVSELKHQRSIFLREIRRIDKKLTKGKNQYFGYLKLVREKVKLQCLVDELNSLIADMR